MDTYKLVFESTLPEFKKLEKRVFVTRDNSNYIDYDFSLSGRSHRVIHYFNELFGDVFYEFDKINKRVKVSFGTSSNKTCFKIENEDLKRFLSPNKNRYSDSFYLMLENLMLATLFHKLKTKLK